MIGKQSGFTLIELMITIGIAAILMSVGIPSFAKMISSSRLTSQFSVILGDLVYARSEAVKRHAPISLCPTSDQSSCNSSSDWDGGWLIFVDDGAGGGTSGDKEVNGSEQILRVSPELHSDIEIKFQNFASSNGILFDENAAMENGDIASIGQMVICDQYGASDAKGVSFSVIGFPRVLTDTNSTGVVDYINSSDNLAEVNCSF